MQIQVTEWEGARGTYGRVKNLVNCQITHTSHSDTTYGWEGKTIIETIDASLSAFFTLRKVGNQDKELEYEYQPGRGWE